MTYIPPHQQQARERESRYARRDGSPIPLSRQEQAERRHHKIVGLWQHAFFWGPTVIALALQLAFSGAWIALIVVFLMRAAALVIGGGLMIAVDSLFSPGRQAWLVVNTAIHALAGAGAVVLTYQGMVSTNGPISEVWLAAAGGLALAVWPMLHRSLRSSMPTGYERIVWAAQNAGPTRIVE
jgi:hypothetical protein